MKPACPRCGGAVVKDGMKRGVQRYLCLKNSLGRRQGVKCWEGEAPIGRDEAKAKGVDKKTATTLRRQIRAARGVHRYVITAAQNATDVNRPFLASLEAYCRFNEAQLIVIPYRYKNPTSVWSKAAEHDDWWAPEVVPYLMNQRTAIGKHVVILADIMTQPTATSPLQGFETIVGGRSAIIGHPKLELTTVPTPQNKLPCILTTTGAVTVKNYIPAKAGKKAEHHHTFGACLLEIDGDAFHMRQINAVRDGSFTDLNFDYSGDERREVRAAGLAMGDFHEEFACPQVVDATFGKGGMLDVLNPEKLMWHDLHDFYSRNHHHRFEVFTNYAKHHAGVDDVEAALDRTFATLDRLSRPGVENIIVPSNHPDALGRWVKETDWKTDPRNAKFILKTALAMVEASEMTNTGAQTIDPFVYWAKRKMKSAKQTVFLSRDESLLIRGIEVGYHGDRGANGARGSRKGFSKIGVKTVIGHSHTPGITDGAYQVGTTSRLRLEYNSGPSSWLNTHCVIYANGKRALINIINGKWRAE